jgi:predicted DsbA family dithiol-disulfide isomerase
VDDTLVMYSDHVYPFCYLGRHPLNQYQEKREDGFEIARRQGFSECRTRWAVMTIMPT